MPRLEGELETAIEDPATCADLVDFTCGDARLHAEDVVELIVRQLHAGERSSATLLVTRELPSRRFVGLSAVEWRSVDVVSPAFDSAAYKDAAYLAVLALSEPLRGRWQCRRGRPLSGVLMRETLSHIALVAGMSIPPVLGLVDHENATCLRFIADHGFRVIADLGNELLVARKRNLPLAATPIVPVSM